ncbi:oxygen-insensitive NADPH nitroreductase [Helicovermis profundi]|uniref:Oxygen-insensitive NADPH nitroreductase n=1 Tax=Helicovermis profundi TaxID=3065157 RepID=A0AAU9EAR8_9FIRM|nr:oxygen-insensitive NADPH nitroreductase [Clostridia bacterium S502]
MNKLNNNIIELISNHTSCRKYSDKKIDEKVLREILNKSQYASTSSFLQLYSVIRVKNDENRKKIAYLAGEQKYIETAAEFLIFCADLNRIEKIALNYDIKVDTGYIESFITATVDASLYAENVILAAESLGIGGVFIGGIRNNPREISNLLKIPKNVYPVFGMCLGYPEDDFNQSKKPRLPLDIVLKEDYYYEDDKKSLEEYDEKIKTYYIKRTNGKINSTWTEQVSKRMEGENRPHMKKYLEDQDLNNK